MEFPKKEFSFAFLYEKETNYFPFDKLSSILNTLSEELKCKITPYYIEQNEIEEKLKDIKNLDMVTSDPKSAAFIPKILSHFKNLTWVHSMFAGVDKFISQKEIGENDNITLTNARGAFAGPLAEYTILAMLYFNYNVPTYINCQENHKWTKLTNTMLDKRTLLIIGYGRNGVAIAKRAKCGFNMKVLGIVRELRENIEGKEFTDELYGFKQLNKDIIGKADFILATLPDTNESRGLFDKKFFESMKKDAIFINIGRGNAVIEQDLIEALNKDVIRGAVLDVCQHEPLDKDDKLYEVSKNKLFITNHCGDFTTDYIVQAYELLIQNIRSYIKDGKLSTIVRKKLGY
jgi:phosphoglycerate dehydrogenase-like enzyme